MIQADPKDHDEWMIQYKDVLADFQLIEIEDPIELAEGEIVELHVITRETLKVNRTYKELQGVKDRGRRLKSIAQRWYDQKIAEKTLEAGRMSEFNNQEQQKAYGKQQAEEELDLLESAKLLMEMIHDERSRLWQYRKDLENIGNNVRCEMKMQ